MNPKPMGIKYNIILYATNDFSLSWEYYYNDNDVMVEKTFDLNFSSADFRLRQWFYNYFVNVN